MSLLWQIDRVTTSVTTSVTRAYGRDFTIAVGMQKYKPAHYIRKLKTCIIMLNNYLNV